MNSVELTTTLKTVNLFNRKVIPSVQNKRTRAEEKIKQAQDKFAEYTKGWSDEKINNFCWNLSANKTTFEEHLHAMELKRERELQKAKEPKEPEPEESEEFECPNCSGQISCFDCFGSKFKPDPNELITFGKYKGHRSHDIFVKDYKYCKWMFNNCKDCPRYLKYVFKNE